MSKNKELNLDKMNSAAVETVLENAAELMKGDKALLSMAAGIVAASLDDAWGDAIETLVTTTLKCAKDAESSEDFNKLMKKKLVKSKKLESFHGSLRFLAAFTKDVAMAAAADVVESRVSGSEDEEGDPLARFARDNFQSN